MDEVFKKIGEFRQYQWRIMIFLGYFLLTAAALNGGIVVFITAEPDWKCVDGYMNNTVCRFNKSVTLTSDDYKARCKMPREAWTFVDDFTSTVTEVVIFKICTIIPHNVALIYTVELRWLCIRYSPNDVRICCYRD